MNNISIEQWTALCQLIIFPACLWIVKSGSKKLIKELHEIVDSRADAVAVRRAREVEKELIDLKKSLDDQFKLHEQNDERRFKDLSEQITSFGKLIRP